MKKFLAILFLLAFTITFANAQTGQSKTLGTGIQYYEYAGKTIDTSNTTGTWYYDVTIPQISDRVFFNIQAKVHNNGSAKGAFVVQGKVFSTDSYTTLLSMNTPYGGGQDSTINFTSQTTGSANRYFRVLYTSTAGETKITWLKYSFKK